MNLRLLSILAPAFVLLSACSDALNHLPGVDPWMDGNPADFATFAANADEGPVVMINLLKFRETSLNADGTGAEAYARYGALAAPFVEKHGGEMVWLGEALEHLIGDTNYDWDSVLLVRWPARQSLLDLTEDEGYQQIAHHRKNGLERTILIALDEQFSSFTGVNQNQ